MKSFEVVLRVNRTSSNMHICNIVSPIHNVWNVPPSYFPGSQRKIPLFILTYVTFKVFKNLVCDLSFVDLSFPSRPTSITVRGSVFSHRLVMQVDQKSIYQKSWFYLLASKSGNRMTTNTKLSCFIWPHADGKLHKALKHLYKACLLPWFYLSKLLPTVSKNHLFKKYFKFYKKVIFWIEIWSTAVTVSTHGICCLHNLW